MTGIEEPVEKCEECVTSSPGCSGLYCGFLQDGFRNPFGYSILEEPNVEASVMFLNLGECFGKVSQLAVLSYVPSAMKYPFSRKLLLWQLGAEEPLGTLLEEVVEISTLPQLKLTEV